MIHVDSYCVERIVTLNKEQKETEIQIWKSSKFPGFLEFDTIILNGRIIQVIILQL